MKRNLLLGIMMFVCILFFSCEKGGTVIVRNQSPYTLDVDLWFQGAAAGTYSLGSIKSGESGTTFVESNDDYYVRSYRMFYNDNGYFLSQEDYSRTSSKYVGGGETVIFTIY